MVIQPHIWDKFIIYNDGPGRKITASLIIKLIDNNTGKEPIGRIEVVIRKEEIKRVKDIRSVKNLSGYFVFTNLDDWEYPVHIESEYYLPVKKSIDMVTMKTLENLEIEFKVAGPLNKATSSKLKTVSELQKGYIVKFENPAKETEQRIITKIDSEKNIIYWKEGLKYKFNSQGSKIKVLNYLFVVFLEPVRNYPLDVIETT